MTDQCVAIGKMIEGVLGLKAGIIELSKSSHCKEKHCPIVITGHNHYDISNFLVADGAWNWTCPFCGHYFST